MARAHGIDLTPSGNCALRDGNDGQWSTFVVQIGTPPQVVRILPSTSGSELMALLPEGCVAGLGLDLADCTELRGVTFRPNTSSSFARIGGPNSYFDLPLPAETSLAHYNGPGSAEVGSDNVTIGWQDYAGPSLENLTVFAYAVKQPFVGQFGLNAHPLSVGDYSHNYESPLAALRRTGAVDSLAWSYTAGAHYRGDFNSWASLTIGGFDTSRFEANAGRVEWKRGVNELRDLLVTLSEISISWNAPGTASLSSLTSSSQAEDLPITIFVDSTVTQLYLLNDSHHTSLLERNLHVVFTLQSEDTSVKITLPYGAFDLKASYPLLGDQVNASVTSYYFPLQRAQNESQYVLGRTFLQEAYLTVDYDRDTFSIAPAAFPNPVEPADKRNTIVPIHPPASEAPKPAGKHQLTPGTIAGVVLGIVAAIGVFFIWRASVHRSRKAKRLREEVETEVARTKAEIDSKPTKAAPYSNLEVVEEQERLELPGQTCLAIELMNPSKSQMREAPRTPGDVCETPLAELDAENEVMELAADPVLFSQRTIESARKPDVGSAQNS